jgi:hypothetical protein
MQAYIHLSEHYRRYGHRVSQEVKVVKLQNLDGLSKP